MAEKEWKKPSWFEHDINYAQQEEIILLIDIHGPQAYGVHWLLQEFLAAQENYRANLKVVPGLVRKFNTTQAIMQAVLFESGLYSIQNDEFFFSPQLCEKLLKFEDFKQLQAQRAKLGALKKEEKRQEQIKELEAKLSESDSSQPQYITIHNITEQDKTIENTLYKERESFSNFKKRIIAEYRGKTVCNCIEAELADGRTYLLDAELQISATEYLQVSGRVLSSKDAMVVWAWLAANPQRVGDIKDITQLQLKELRGKRIKGVDGEISELEKIEEDKYIIYLENGTQKIKYGPVALEKIELVEEIPAEKIHPRVAELIGRISKTA